MMDAIVVSPEEFFQLSLLNDSRLIFRDDYCDFKVLDYKGTHFAVNIEKFKRFSLTRLLKVSGDLFSEETRNTIKDRIAEGEPT